MREGWKTLRVRLTAWYLLLLALTLAVFSAFVYVRLERTLLRSADESLAVAAGQALAYVADDRPELAFADTEAYRHAARHLNQAGFSIRLLRPDGEPIVGFGRQNGLPWPPRPAPGLVTADAHDAQYGNQSWRTHTRQLVSPQGGTRGWIQATRVLAPIDEALSGLYWAMLAATPLLLLLTGAGGVFLADRALRPIDKLTHLAAAIEAKDLSRRIGDTGSRDEVGRLAATFDKMLDRLEHAFETERRFTADASHELRTPLTAIKGRIGVMLARGRSMDEYRATLQEIEREADRLIRVSNDLLLLARLDRGSIDWDIDDIDLSELLPSVADQMAAVAQAEGICIELAVEPRLSMRGSIDHLIRVLLNVLDNAIKYSPPGARIFMTAKAEGPSVRIDVVDQGPGIPAEALSRLTERFFRVERDRSRQKGGSGLGLSIVNEIVHRHGGQLTFSKGPSGGTCVSLAFARSEAARNEVGELFQGHARPRRSLANSKGETAMNAKFLATVAVFVLTVLGSTEPHAQIASLPTLNVDVHQTSVSGLSSGGYMAVQFHVAFSSSIKGAGIIAGGPYFCAKDDQNTAISACSCIGLACQPSQAAQEVPRLIQRTDQNASQASIDATSHLANSRVWLFSGSSDTVVPTPIMNALETYYKHYIGASNVSFEKSVAAEHAMPTNTFGNPCNFKGDPFINDCSFDAAGALLKWIYGSLNPKNTGTLSGKFIEFDQSEFIANPASHGMWPTGWAYVPASCQQNAAACKVHVVFHGCKQYPGSPYSSGPQGQIGDTYVKNTGYNQWADTNNIVVLYPQANAMNVGTRLPRTNPNGCWDWWGYDDAAYSVKSGRQMAAVKAMVDRLGGTAPEPVPPAFCGTASNANHVSAGRAYRFFWWYFAQGSNEFLGFSGSTQTTLKETGAGSYQRVASCP